MKRLWVILFVVPIFAQDAKKHNKLVYSLDRDIEIVVVDGERTFGNSYCLPAGPCREPKTRPFFEANFIVNTFPEVFTIHHPQS